MLGQKNGVFGSVANPSATLLRFEIQLVAFLMVLGQITVNMRWRHKVLQHSTLVAFLSLTK